MSFTNLTPLTASAIGMSQTGIVSIDYLDNTKAGATGGHSGGGIQHYTEILAGEECGKYTAADNTSGTKFYPDVKYFTSIKSLSIDLLVGSLIEVEISAKSVDGHNLSRVFMASGTVYDPDGLSGTYLYIFHGDEINGKFNRVALYKTPSSRFGGRILLTKGPSLK